MDVPRLGNFFLSIWEKLKVDSKRQIRKQVD